MDVNETIQYLMKKRFEITIEDIKLCNEAIIHCKKNNFYEEQIRLYSIMVGGFIRNNKISEVPKCYEKIEEIRDNNPDDIKLQNLANCTIGLYHWNCSRYQQALDLFLQALYNETNEEQIARIKHKIAVSYLKLNNYSKSIMYFEDVYNDLDKITDNYFKQDLLTWYSIFYNEIGIISKAVELAQEAIIINTKISNFEGLANNYNTIGLSYKYLRYNDQSMSCFIKSEQNALIANTPILLANVYNNIALIYTNQKDYEKAIEYYEKSIEFRIKCTGLDQLSITYRNLVPLYLLNNQIKKAKTLLLEMKKLVTDIKTERGKINYLVSKSDIAIYENNSELAKQSLDSALILTQKLNNLSIIKTVYYKYSEFYEKQKKYKQALKYLKLNNEIDSKLQKNEDIKLTENLTLQHQALFDRFKLNNKIQEEKINAVIALSVTANHEINQPLMLIQGNLDLLKDSITDMDDKKIKYLDNMENAVSKIKEILTNFTQKTNISFVNYLNKTKMVKFDD